MYHLEQETHLLILTYSGDVDFEQRLKAAQELEKLLRNENKDFVGLLVDCRKMHSTMSVEEEQKFGQYIATHPVLQTIKKVAMVHQSRENPTIFLQSYAYANGLNIVPFIAYYEARSWLDGNLP